MATYAVGDIHGCFDEWIQLKDRIEAQDSDAKFILVGDIIDRGQKTLEMLDWAIENITDNGKYQMILGNHESEKIRWLRDYFAQKAIDKDMTIKDMRRDQYNFYDICVHNNIKDEQLKNILDWFNTLSYYKEVYVNMQKGKQRFIILHAYLPDDCINKDGSFKKTSIKFINNPVKHYNTLKLKDLILWYRNYHGYYGINSIIVHGHTPTIFDECIVRGAKGGKIWYTAHDINIDCGIVYLQKYEKANLAAIRLEDLQEFYVYEYKEQNKKNEIPIHKKNMLERSKRQPRHKSLIDDDYFKYFQ